MTVISDIKKETSACCQKNRPTLSTNELIRNHKIKENSNENLPLGLNFEKKFGILNILNWFYIYA